MIPADVDFWTWVLPVVAIYFVMGFVIWLMATGVAEQQDEDSFWRVTLATYAAFWIVWPIATVLLVLWLLVFGAVAMTVDAWNVRNEGRS